MGVTARLRACWAPHQPGTQDIRRANIIATFLFGTGSSGGMIILCDESLRGPPASPLGLPRFRPSDAVEAMYTSTLQSFGLARNAPRRAATAGAEPTQPGLRVCDKGGTTS